MRKSLLGIAVLFSTASAFAGAISGGGGRSVVCRNAEGAISSAQLLDLYEGATQYGYTITESSDSVYSQAHNAIVRIGAGRGDDYAAWIDMVQKNMRLLPDGTDLLPVDDSHEVIVPAQCKVEQLANFEDDKNVLLVNGSIWEKLSDTNKAALITHEALYKLLRFFGENNSARTRQAVAFAFSGGEFQPYQAGLPQDALKCFGEANANDPTSKGGSIFWAYNDNQGNLVFQFDFIFGKPVLTRSVAKFEKTSITEISKHVGDSSWNSIESNLGETSIVVTFTNAFNQAPGFAGKLNLGIDYPNSKFTCSR